MTLIVHVAVLNQESPQEAQASEHGPQQLGKKDSVFKSVYY